MSATTKPSTTTLKPINRRWARRTAREHRAMAEQRRAYAAELRREIAEREMSE